jgi:hypothetical protein
MIQYHGIAEEYINHEGDFTEYNQLCGLKDLGGRI